MSMLRCFFENTGNKKMNEQKSALFTGTKIMGQGREYLCHMNGYPTISLTLKSAKQPTWDLSYNCIKDEIRKEFKRHRSIMDILDLDEDKRRYNDIMILKGRDHDYVTALQFLMDCLCQEYQKPVVILIDEYDVPLENAYFSGFYEEMVALIRSLLESALKMNGHLAFAVITGCLRITKESIFTGFNNLQNYLTRSNRESGDGRLDIVVRSPDILQPPVFLELKVSDSFKGMERACENALQQIENKRYDYWVQEEGYTEAWFYGIAFFRKQCMVKVSHKVYTI